MSTRLQVGVKALLRDREGKFLLLRRTPVEAKEFNKMWDTPGGRIDPGSTLMENLRREIAEETGLDMPEDPKLVAAQDLLFEYPSSNHIVRLTYVGVAGDGEPRLSEEHTEFGWFTLAEMRKMPDLDRYLKELIDRGVIV